MSYCRWSSMDFLCDLYVYANVSGAWTIHVAGNRFVDGARVDITLPHAGGTFDTESPGKCADKCEELIALGYLAPDYLVPNLRAEEADMDAEVSDA